MTAVHAPAPPVDGRGTAEDVLVAGRVRVRLLDATSGDRAAVVAQLGSLGPAEPVPADITVRYVPRIAVPKPMRLVGPGELGVDDGGGLIVLRGRHRRPTRVRIPMGDLGRRCEITCEHGVGRVPHLIAVVNLALLRHDSVALHASAVEVDGRAVVATGWSKGGKTEVVLALLAAGARLVGDEWLHLAPDGSVTGIHEPVRVWDWQVAQLPQLRASLAHRDRARLRLAGATARAVRRRSPRLATVIDRQRGIDVDQHVVSRFQIADRPVPVGPVVLVTSAECRTITVAPVCGHEVADRMAASLAYERTPLRELADAHRFAFPHVPLPALDGAMARERALLHERLDGRPAIEVVHPYPVDLHHLGAVVVDAIGGLR